MFDNNNIWDEDIPKIMNIFDQKIKHFDMIESASVCRRFLVDFGKFYIHISEKK